MYFYDPKGADQECAAEPPNLIRSEYVDGPDFVEINEHPKVILTAIPYNEKAIHILSRHLLAKHDLVGGALVLSRFSSGYLIAILAIKETEHGATIR